MTTPFIPEHHRSIKNKYSEIDIMLDTYPRKWTKNEHKELFDCFVSNVEMTSLMNTMYQSKANSCESKNRIKIDDNVRVNKLLIKLQYKLYEKKYNQKEN